MIDMPASMPATAFPRCFRHNSVRRASPVRENGRMSLFRDDGIVLRTQKLGEADRIMLCLPGGRPPGPLQNRGGGARR
ncbi:hypothetical protein GCM10023237_46580 [Streptomyces coeruleoprunus]